MVPDAEPCSLRSWLIVIPRPLVRCRCPVSLREYVRVARARAATQAGAPANAAAMRVAKASSTCDARSNTVPLSWQGSQATDDPFGGLLAEARMHAFHLLFA